jgi:hypothetical protein
MTATVVLVHGAWHGAWCFDRVMPLLREANVPAVAVDLPGHGQDRGPFTDLHGDASRVLAVLDGIDGDVVLLGHSYGAPSSPKQASIPRYNILYICVPSRSRLGSRALRRPSTKRRRCLTKGDRISQMTGSPTPTELRP